MGYKQASKRDLRSAGESRGENVFCLPRARARKIEKSPRPKALHGGETEAQTSLCKVWEILETLQGCDMSCFVTPQLPHAQNLETVWRYESVSSLD